MGFTSTLDGKSVGFAGVPFGRALRIKMWERIKKLVEPRYVFPRNAGTSFDDEVAELKSPIDGVIAGLLVSRHRLNRALERLERVLPR